MGSTRVNFSASPAVAGIPDFKVYDIDTEEVARALQSYVERGSRLTGVGIEDINTGVTEIPVDVSKATLVDLIERGMKLFDAIIWLTAGRPIAKPLVRDASIKKEDIVSMHEIARSLFYCYFFILTQARYPAVRSMTDKPKVANFLTVVMGMSEEQHVYVERICSFVPQKFNMSWVRHINFSGLGQETLSRFGLGVAGYRLFGPFKLYEPKPDYPESLKPAVEFAQKIATTAATWDVHPATRNAEILTTRGNLNKNLSNLILEVFTEDQIREMVTAKVLYDFPKKEPSYKNYLRWGSEDDISGSSWIFRSGR